MEEGVALGGRVSVTAGVGVPVAAPVGEGVRVSAGVPVGAAVAEGVSVTSSVGFSTADGVASTVGVSVAVSVGVTVGSDDCVNGDANCPIRRLARATMLNNVFMMKSLLVRCMLLSGDTFSMSHRSR
jgi:hypothetical protein